MNKFIKFKIKKNTGIISLNRPEALNALNIEMAEVFLNKLIKWNLESSIKRVLLIGEGKAFCAGGDVKSMFLSTGVSNLKKDFLRTEYTLNYAINQFSKPYLSIWNGIVMGGGVGLSIYGNYRVATEKSKFAMPETAIGFFPDVGGSYFLSKISNNIGLYLGLTGHVLNVHDLINFKLATHCEKSEKIKELEENYINYGTLPNSNMDMIDEEKHTIKKDEINFIADTFQGDLKSIMQKLKNSSMEFAKKTYNNLLKRCPVSLAITVKLLNKAKKLSLKECLEMEYQLSQHVIYRNDFNNGVDSVLIRKNYNPAWNPLTINKIDFNQINNYFKPHVKPLNLK